MNKPKISICIPTYNRADLIGMTLESVARQTVKPAEVLIIDNASTDDTEKIVASYVKHHGFTYIRNKTNIGMAENYNRCIDLAKNEYFTILPSDDLIAPTWYEEWQTVIAEHDADLYISPLSIMDEKHDLIAAFPVFEESVYLTQPEVMKVLFNKYLTAIPPLGMYVFKKKIFDRISRYDSAHGTECDVQVGMDLLYGANVYYYHKFLFVFREHPVRSFDETKEDRNSKFLKRFENYLQIIQKIYKSRYEHSPHHRFFLHGTLFMNLCNINLYIARFEFYKVMRSYALTFRYFPTIFWHPSDWGAFIKYQFEFIKRALTMRFIPLSIKVQMKWLREL